MNYISQHEAEYQEQKRRAVLMLYEALGALEGHPEGDALLKSIHEHPMPPSVVNVQSVMENYLPWKRILPEEVHHFRRVAQMHLDAALAAEEALS
jgi:hypothetical protein